jgi:hypothetical protein
MATEERKYITTSTSLTDDTCATINVTSDELAALIATPASYEKIDITLQHNCCVDEVYTDEILDIASGAPFTGTHSSMTGAVLTVLPTIVDSTALVFPEGVWSITIKIIKLNGDYTQEEQCVAMLCVLKCILAELEFTQNMPIHLAYFALVNGNNCPCACDKMCELYAYISTALNLTDTTICETC